MSIKKLWGDSCFDRYFFLVLIAIQILMSFTFLGHIHIPPISVTIACLPILAAGCLFGPMQAVIVAIVFGIAGIFKTSASYVLPADAVFSPFSSGAPVNSLVLSIGTRVLFGCLAGVAFQCARKCRHSRVWIGLTAAATPKIHSLIVNTAFGLLFPAHGRTFQTALRWRINDMVFVLICVVVIELLWTVYQGDFVQRTRMCIDQSFNNPYASKKISLFFLGFELFLVCMSVFTAIYFSQRESYMLERHGVAVSSTISSDLLLLQIQFLIASLAMNVITVILLTSTYKYMSYKEYLVEIDALTSVMGRRMFLYYCDKAQKTNASADCVRTGWFLFVDVDYFKEINDTFGHSAGDTVLREIAQHLQHLFTDAGKVGRIGGDEFAVILEEPLAQQEVARRLKQFLENISGILPAWTVSCSIGAYQFAFPQTVKRLLEDTDVILYQAKKNGRAGYVIRACDSDGTSALTGSGSSTIFP
ncbi:MAG: diguanylate cyclase [Lachnospiraceae bacterium]|nr:diguanylate cyclase [Lachnospiraceae bacterium]